MKTSFFIQLTTAFHCLEEDQYNDEADTMVNVLKSVLTDAERMAELTKAEITSCHSEIDVTQAATLVGRALVDIEADKKVQIDKTKLSAMFRKVAPWKIKIEKRAVDLEVVADAESAVL